MYKKNTHEQKQERIERFRQLADAGMSSAEIAEILGIKRSGVYAMTSLLGVRLARACTRKKSTSYSSCAFQVLKELFHNRTLLDTEIADRLDCTREFVGQVRGWMTLNHVVKA